MRFRQSVLHDVGIIDTGSHYTMVSYNRLIDRQLQSITQTKVKVFGVGGAVPVKGQVVVDVVLDDTFTVKNVTCLVIDQDIPTLVGLNVIENSSVKSYTFNKDRTIEFTMVSGECLTVKMVDCLNLGPSLSYYAVPDLPNLASKVKWIRETLGVRIGGYDTDQDKSEQMADLIIKYNDVFGNETNMGMYPKPVRIKTAGDPISARQYPIPVKYQALADKEINNMLKLGVIEPIDDCQGWSTPIVCVGKKGNGVRICANYKLTLNKRVVAPEPYLVPSCDELLANVKPNNQYFSSMDLYKGYWQCLIEP